MKKGVNGLRFFEMYVMILTSSKSFSLVLWVKFSFFGVIMISFYILGPISDLLIVHKATIEHSV